MIKFEAGFVYVMHSNVNPEVTWEYRVMWRDSNRIVLRDSDGVERKYHLSSNLAKVYGCEAVRPIGQYNMAPVLLAKNKKVY